ncbi:MAG: GAF domain-containing sensor histidine kinase [Candidatus Koribacter versatilis]|uniref:Oxygen sensor histidine kinase NreB n=1 Tax=Candidatus Korobacter versatilis TaxID=658062 RepID=A0A932EPN9_9BACT|nr:GAF domain-containing sensor histidine kinase [Candidatus Koribacter versatilis]
MSAPAVLPLKESLRESIVGVARSLEPYFPDITVIWRNRVQAEFGADGRVLMALERLNISTGCTYFCHGDFEGFFENLQYFGVRLAKLEVDTRIIARSLDLYGEGCAPYLRSLFGDRRAEASTAIEMLAAATFTSVSGAYFDAKTRESAALLSILDAELSAEDVSSLLERVLKITAHTFGANLGAIVLLDPDGETLRVRAATGVPDDVDDMAIPLGKGAAGRVVQTGEPIMVFDTSNESNILLENVRSLAKTLWGVPLRLDNVTLGALVIGFDKPYEWLPTERALMRAIAERSSLALDRARINDALRERESRIAELSAHLLQVQEEERKRISRELHDETGQGLMVIRLYLGMLETATAGRTARSKIRETLSVVDRTIEGIRRIIAKLSPLVLQELGLMAAIRKEAKDLARNTGVKARVVIPDSVGRLAPEIEAAIYRVVQEALHNVAKHAHAKSVTIQIGRVAGVVRVLVEDDGVGFSGRSSNSRGHSFGLAGIKERIASLGGTVRVQSGRGKGTRLDVSVPAGEVVTGGGLAQGASASIH